MKKVLSIAAAVSVLFYGCIKKSNTVSSSQVLSSESIVAVSIALDYSEGNMGSYSITDSTVYKNLLPIYSDNDIRTYKGSIYAIERNGKDNVIKISGPIIADSTVVYQKNIGTSINIQDIAFISDTKAYITQYADSKVVIFNPAIGIKATKTIDISLFDTYAGTDSAESVPYMSKEAYYQGKVYIACQRLKTLSNGYMTPADTSLIVVINAVSDSVEKAIKLLYKNPQELSLCNGKLYVASVGAFGSNDGGIERIDLSTGVNEGIVVNETALHGDVESIIVMSDTKGYAVISTQSYATELYPFNPSAKTVGAKISGIDSPCSNHMAFYGGFLFIGDRSLTNSGIVEIDTATDKKVGYTKNIGIPPNSLALLELQ